MTLVGPGSWAAIRGAVDAALTAADLVSSGERLAYALCRPPGHHATPSAYGGSCYLNNAAVAAQALRAAGARRVAVLDIDAHHGNGTQAIFYHRADVWYGSLHVDPGAGWFPHYLGYADERGTDAGAGANRNIPLAPGTGDDGWLAALDELLKDVISERPVDALVVSLGVDAAAGDPESPLEITEDAYREAGRKIAALGPAVFVQEGGYDLASLGGLVVATLEGAAACSGKWQAATCPGPNARSGGSSRAHRSWANGQRVRNRQPDGGVDRAGQLALDAGALASALAARGRAPGWWRSARPCRGARRAGRCPRPSPSPPACRGT